MGTDTNGTAIAVRELVKKYGEEVTAVAGIDLTVPTNAIFALLGPNGAGKTTTVSILTTMALPTEGTVTVMGLDVVKQADAVRKRIGVTFQEIVLDVDLTGRETLEFHGRLYGQSKAKRQAKIDELLAMVELEEAADRRVKTYSGGMKRRLELARGLMTEPEVLFLDEPTQGLDPQNRAGIWDYIHKLRDESNLTLLLTTHYMDEAEVLADRVAIMDYGRIVAEDTPQALVDQMGADIIQIAGSGSRDAFATALEATPFVQSSSSGNGLIQIGVDHGNKRLAKIVTLANETNYNIEDISVAKPSLGDVFLKYTGRQLRDK